MPEPESGRGVLGLRPRHSTSTHVQLGIGGRAPVSGSDSEDGGMNPTSNPPLDLLMYNWGIGVSPSPRSTPTHVQLGNRGIPSKEPQRGRWEDGGMKPASNEGREAGGVTD